MVELGIMHTCEASWSCVRNLTCTAAGPLAFDVSWNKPNDLGAGPDQPYPLLSYHMIVQTTVGAPNATSQGSLEYAVAGDTKSFQVVNLVKGSSYFISLRARNDARSSPDEQDWGYGPWGVAISQCTSGAPLYGKLTLHLVTTI
jgi:hypothetical protein